MATHKPALAPLGMTCSDTDCEHGLHYFKPTKKNPAGHCQHCKADIIDWQRLHARDIGDAEHTVQALHCERIRHHNWTVAFDSEALRKAHRLGLQALGAAVERRIRSKGIAGIPTAWDGRQTSKTGSVVNYAQHATACCCRKCIEYWHGIPRDRELTEQEIAYLVNLMMLYLHKRLSPLETETDSPLTLPQGGVHE